MGEGGREAPEGEDICIQIADSLHCIQKLTQHHKATILQKKNFFKESVNKPSIAQMPEMERDAGESGNTTELATC